MNKIKAAIIGSTGYGGVELIRILAHHPYVEIASVISSSSAGAPITDGYPHLTEIVTDVLEDVNVERMREQVDVVFAATPSGVSSEIVPKLIDAGLIVVDLSGDFRITPGSLYEQWYQHRPAAENYLQQAVYGLSEVFADEIREARLLSNPGCYSTTALLSLIPALHNGWIDPKTIIIDGKSGASGAGRKIGLSFHYAELNESVKPYKVNQHQHIPEIELILGRIAKKPVTTTFTTHLIPMTRGIMCTSYASLLEDISEEQLIAQYREYYQGRPFVRIRDKGKWPATKEVLGSNYCDIGFSVDARTNRVTILSVTDNVMKGAAGQAVQNLNLMMGWEETTGLQMVPVYP